MVEQGTENPRVGSSILSLGTIEKSRTYAIKRKSFFCFYSTPLPRLWMRPSRKCGLRAHPSTGVAQERAVRPRALAARCMPHRRQWVLNPGNTSVDPKASASEYLAGCFSTRWILRCSRGHLLTVCLSPQTTPEPSTCMPSRKK